MRDGFVMRYRTQEVDDGLPPGEGAFLACSFWLAENLALQGRLEDAKRIFERLLALRSDVGLLSEEYDVSAKRLVGNFPQALSHLALVNTALKLSGHKNVGQANEGDQATLRRRSRLVQS
jgi:GH15 family glucan-1,4-alpha-glucosidase